MKMKRIRMRAAAAVVAAALFLSGGAKAAPAVSAESAVLLDAATGEVLFARSPDRRSLIASTTKIMTGLLAAEAGGLDRYVSVPPEAAGIEGSSLYLKAGERVSVRELLYGMMLQSGNDAAAALAIRTAGSVPAFVEKMNGRAAQLGLRGTHFANPNGLDDPENYSTARDLALLARAAMENETFRTVVSTRSIRVGARSLSNHNKLLWRYDGAEGVKTGFTKKAGRVLVSAAERGGRRLIAVTIRAPDDWNDHAAMLDYGFSAFETRTLAREGDLLGGAPVLGGDREAVRFAAAGTAEAMLRADEKPLVRICAPRVLFAPVTAGETVGWAEFRVGGAVLSRVPLVCLDACGAREEKKKKNLISRILGG